MSLFRQPQQPQQQTSNTFGGGTTQPQQQQSAGGLFGAAQPNTTQPATTSLFGQPNTSQQAPPLFGAANTLFGAAKQRAVSLVRPSSHPQHRGSSLFGGGSTNSNMQQRPGLFSGVPSSSNIFGASTANANSAPKSAPAFRSSFGLDLGGQQQHQQPNNAVGTVEALHERPAPARGRAAGGGAGPGPGRRCADTVRAADAAD
ncbi:hypothetical protein B0H14DRAFT_3683269 [Mycena olivaceomarginata]|nr:hypothetical protein B0H14DRAFT_3683269 [Mycena olivaceomarginata]